jgi:deoxyribonuclease-4
VFTKSPSQWRAAPLSPAECIAFRSGVKERGLKAVVAHDAYLTNLASPDPKLYKMSKAAFKEQLHRCSLLGIPAIVMHPGSHKGTGEKVGLRRIAAALAELLVAPDPRGVRILLETTAGQGDCLGGRFEHLREIIALLDNHPRLGVCLDTCHIFAAGYDIRRPSSFEKVIKEFDRVIGLDRLSLFHLNDSKGDLGSRLDRHEHIGKGKIGPEAFRAIVRARRFRGIPKIIETPGGVEGGLGDQRNLERLFSFAAQKRTS